MIPDPITREEKYLKEILDAIKEYGLPAIGDEDNEKILRAINGAWTKTAESVPVTWVTLTPTSESTAVASKTNGEIYAVINAGGVVKITLDMMGVAYTAEVSATAEIKEETAENYGYTNLMAVLPNTNVSAWFILQTGDAADDNTDWSLQVVPFPS